MASIHTVDTTMTDTDDSSDDGGIIVGDTDFLWCISNDGHGNDGDDDDVNRKNTINHNHKDEYHGHGDGDHNDCSNCEPLPLVDFAPIYAASRRTRQQQHQQMMMMNGGGSSHGYSRSISSINTDWSTATTKISNTASGNNNSWYNNKTNSDSKSSQQKQKQKKKRGFLQFTKVLMKLLERKDPKVYRNAKTVIQQCEQKKRRGETNSVTEHLKTPLKQVVGYEYWHQARTEAEAEAAAAAAAATTRAAELLSSSSQQQQQQQPQQQQQHGNKSSTDPCRGSSYYHSHIDRHATNNTSISMEITPETFSQSKNCSARSGPVHVKDQTGRGVDSRSTTATTTTIMSDEASRYSHNSLLSPQLKTSSSLTSASHNSNGSKDTKRRRHPHNPHIKRQDDEIRERKKRKWMIISVMMKYLQQKDDDMYVRARGVVNDCLRRHHHHRDSDQRNREEQKGGCHRNGNNSSLSGCIERSLKREIGSYHWRRAESYVHRRLLHNWNEEEGGRRRGEWQRGRQEESSYRKQDERPIMPHVGTL